MLADYKPSNKDDEHSAFYSPLTTRAMYTYLIAKHFPEKIHELDSTLNTLVDEMNSSTINTIFSGFTSIALNAYGETNHAYIGTPEFSVVEKNHDGRVITQLSSEQNDYLKATNNINTNNIELQNPNKKVYFYQLTKQDLIKN